MIRDVTPALGPTTAGHGLLTVERSRGRSVVSRAYATSPLRFLTPRNHGHAAWIYTSSYGGGLVDGDQILLEIEVADGAAAFISTQASTKIFRSPRGTSAQTRGQIGRDALLVVAPEPVVCFARSRYRQVQSFDLASGAALVLVDWVSSGRRASGERWVFDDYESRIQVRLEGKLLVHDVLALRAKDGDLATRLGRFDVLAVAFLAGRAIESAAASLVAKISQDPIVPHSDRLVAASALPVGGACVRVAGCSVEEVGRTIRELLGFLPGVLGDDPWTRKW